MSEKRFKLHHINDLTDQEYIRLRKITDNGELITLGEVVDLLNEQQATITKLRNENIILKNKIEDLRVSLFMQDKELQRQMQKSDLDE